MVFWSVLVRSWICHSIYFFWWFLLIHCQTTSTPPPFTLFQFPYFTFNFISPFLYISCNTSWLSSNLSNYFVYNFSYVDLTRVITLCLTTRFLSYYSYLTYVIDNDIIKTQHSNKTQLHQFTIIKSSQQKNISAAGH